MQMFTTFILNIFDPLCFLLQAKSILLRCGEKSTATIKQWQCQEAFFWDGIQSLDIPLTSRRLFVGISILLYTLSLIHI